MSTLGSYMARTSIKVSEDTHRMVVNTRGNFEQMFKKNLSLDATIYLSARLISFVYERLQKLIALDKIKIQQSEDGSIQIEGINAVFLEILPDLVKEFTEIDSKLAEKEKTLQVISTEQSEGT